jgi:hypothetical protein
VEDWASNGAVGWHGSRVGITLIPNKPGAPSPPHHLGGYEVLSAGSSVYKTYSLPRHRGVRLVFSVVVIDVHRQVDRANLPIRVLADGVLIFSKKIDKNPYTEFAGNLQRKDNYEDGLTAQFPHSSPTLTLKIEMGDESFFSTFRLKDGREYLGNTVTWGYFAIGNFSLTLIDVPVTNGADVPLLSVDHNGKVSRNEIDLYVLSATNLIFLIHQIDFARSDTSIS